MPSNESEPSAWQLLAPTTDLVTPMAVRVAATLRSDHPSGMRMWLDLDGFGGWMDLALTELMHMVRTGQPAWEAVFGAPFWNYLAADPAMAASFDATMAGSLRTTAATGYD
jgi:hypothetical protein